MKAGWRVWYCLEQLHFDDEGFTKAILLGEHGKIVERHLDLSINQYMLVIEYKVWDGKK